MYHSYVCGARLNVGGARLDVYRAMPDICILFSIFCGARLNVSGARLDVYRAMPDSYVCGAIARLNVSLFLQFYLLNVCRINTILFLDVVNINCRL